MATRLNTRRVEADEVQGPGSFVVVRYPTVAEARAIFAANGREEETVVSAPILLRSIVEWNWVDEAGLPLPLPQNPDDLTATLCDNEHRFLLRAVLGLGAPAKN
jgi:hypothetical protein